jgi:Na+/H+ antiporter NhaD/arsenite permease-like protein
VSAAHSHFAGPKCWAITASVGALLGLMLALLAPLSSDASGEYAVPITLVIPFALLLGSIAIVPLSKPHFWHDHFPDFAFFLGALVVVYYLVALRAPTHSGTPFGQYQMLHAALEYIGFLALVGGLYVVSGGIRIQVSARGSPIANTALLAIGAVLANLVGTTGASMLLIRPFMHINAGRLRPLHVVFFIFIVSNCGGALTPIGDPPLYLGFLKGVPFTWTLENMWRNWLLVNGALLAVFFIFDSRIKSTATTKHDANAPLISITGFRSIIALVLMIVGVFVDPFLRSRYNINAGAGGWPIGACFQIIVACVAYALTPKAILSANSFSFFPVKEVGLLFAGIFATMVPALGYLSDNGSALGLSGPSSYYFATGSLSAVLDNAPTYLNFLQVALAPSDVNAASIATLLARPDGVKMLDAISCAAVFFGAMTYIGNGPNFMVKSIAEAAGVKMPGFFAYLGWAALILLPILVLNWALLIR